MIPRRGVLLHHSFKPIDDKYTTTQAQFLPIAVEGQPNFNVSVVQSLNSFNSFNSNVPRVTCSRVDTPPAGLPLKRFVPLSRPVFLNRNGGASVVRVRCPRRRVHVSTNTNGGASVWTFPRGVSWRRGVSCGASVVPSRCPVLNKGKRRKQERRRVPWRVAFTLSEIHCNGVSRGALCPVSSTGTAAALCPQQEQRQQRRRRNDTNNNGVSVALFRVRGGVPWCSTFAVSKRAENGGNAAKTDNRTTAARGVSWRVFQSVKERLKLCPVRGIEPRAENGVPKTGERDTRGGVSRVAGVLFVALGFYCVCYVLPR